MADNLRVHGIWILTALVLAMAGCGGGGSTLDAPAESVATLPPTSNVTMVVVTADVNLDGISDVLEIPLDADEGTPEDEPRCWRGREDGDVERADDWREHPGVDAIRRDLDARPDHDILDDEGAHSAEAEDGAIPYAVLHLESPGDESDREIGDPVIDGMRPDSAHPGALVGIKGTDLAAREEDTTVSFDDLEARVLLALPRFVLAVVPEESTLGDVDVVVTRGITASEAFAFEVVAAPTPMLESVHPDPLVPGILAILHGEHLGTPLDDVTVSFGGVDAETTMALGRKVFAKVPEEAASGLVTVTVNGVTSNGIEVEVGTELDAPTLTAVTPAKASPGSLVRIEGDDLIVIGQRTTVTFGTAQGMVFGREKGAIIAIVPTKADGDIVVSVGERDSEALAFDAVERGVPTITSLDPSSGEAGDHVTILGTDLHDLSALGSSRGFRDFLKRMPRVTFGEHRVFFAFPVVGGLEVVVPFRAKTGDHDVVVTIGDDASDAATFTVK